MSIQLHSENVNVDLNWEKLVENDKVWFASQIGLFKEGSMTRNTKKSVMERYNISKRHMDTCIELAQALALKESLPQRQVLIIVVDNSFHHFSFHCLHKDSS